MEQTNPLSRRDYWFCQSVGWGTLTVFSVISSSFGSLHAALQFALAKLFVMATGLGLSHLWRGRLRRQGWLERPQGFPYARIGAGLLLLAIAQTACLLLSDKVFRGGAFFDETPAMLAFNLALLVFMWLVIYQTLRPTSNIVAWIDWGDGMWAVGCIALIGLALTLLPTLVMTRKYLKV